MSDQNNKPQCFVAMWFGSDTESQNEMTQLFDVVIKPAIEVHSLKAYRVDRDPGADKLDETILNEIDRSDLVVVDLTHDRRTGLRGSVIFEAGYAYRMKPVIWLCREDVVDYAPFDIRQFKQIRWSSYKLLDAKKRLAEAIGARFGERVKERGPHEVKRVIADMWKKLEKAEDIPSPTGGPVFTADQIRSAQFEEFCDDLDTRLKYKEMGLSSQEKYELIDMIRAFKKVVIDLLKSQGKVASMDVYRKMVASKLRASGWF